MSAINEFDDEDIILICNGDNPFISTNTLSDILINKEAPIISNLYSSEAKKKFEEVQSLLTKMNIPFFIDNTFLA